MHHVRLDLLVLKQALRLGRGCQGSQQGERDARVGRSRPMRSIWSHHNSQCSPAGQAAPNPTDLHEEGVPAGKLGHGQDANQDRVVGGPDLPSVTNAVRCS